MNKSKRLLFTLLAVITVFALFAAMPLSASAATGSIKINGVTVVPNLSINASGAGWSWTSSTNTLTLDSAFPGGEINGVVIDCASSDTINLAHTGNITVSVTAGYSILCKGNLIITGNGGKLTVSSGDYGIVANGRITINGGANIKSSGVDSAIYAGGDITINSGAVEASANIEVMRSDNGNVTINGGKVDINTLSGSGISSNNGNVTISNGDVTINASNGINAEKGNVTVNCGTVRATGTSGIAIYSRGESAIVNISGGTVESASGNAIRIDGAATVVTVSGSGNVAAPGDVIRIEGVDTVVTVSGGTVSATGTGTSSAIYITGASANTTVNVSGGTVSSAAAGLSHAICSDGASSKINVSGGTLKTVGQYGTIHMRGTGPVVNVSGGFVFGYGTAINGENNVIYMKSGTPTIGGTGVACAWNNKAGHTEYTKGTSTDLIVNSGATVSWDRDIVDSSYPPGYASGIKYAYGSNTGFFPLTGVSVYEGAAVPTITGPTAMSLTVGYAATSTGAYTITGDHSPIVEKTSGNAAILWNSSVKKLEIAAGLAVGTYPVELKATNGVNPDATLTFTLTVTAGTVIQPTAFPFTDVPASAWYYNDVKTAWEQGLINGKTATTFAPDDNLTYAEAVKLAACMHQKHATGAVTLANGTPNWYDSYVKYAKDNGIINKDYAWNAQATRAGYMEIFASALPEDALGAINFVPNGSIPDVAETHPQATAIYKLYRAGILQGVDAAHNCNPGSSIKRSEVAAILTRMMNEDVRISFSMGPVE